jgi:hypothetical protein
LSCLCTIHQKSHASRNLHLVFYLTFSGSFFLVPFTEVKIIGTGFRAELASSERITAVGAEYGKTHGTFLQHCGFFFANAAKFAF